MNISEEFLHEISSQLLSYKQICDYFNLSIDDRKNPNAGEWIVTWIKELQKLYAVRKYTGGIPKETPKPSPIRNKPFEDEEMMNKFHEAKGAISDEG